MKLLAHALVAASFAGISPSDEKEHLAIEHGRACCQRFFAGELGAIWDEFDDSMRGLIGSEENLKLFHDQALEQLGAELSVVEESAAVKGAAAAYSRKARFEKTPLVIEVAFEFDATNRIAGFVIQPVPKEAPSEFLEYRTKTKLRLPFEGEWDVFWGGRTLAQNYHTVTEDQRFAYDIMILRDGSSHAGEGKKNEDYYCFGQPILAPGAGVVVAARDGIEDNVPGESKRPEHAAGNHLVLDHGNGEYSMLAHFKKGSLMVKPGDRVEPGAKIGLCGNSGNSSEPHLHYHLQNTPEFLKGKGFPAEFEAYVADGKPIERGEPVKGQRIRNQ